MGTASVVIIGNEILTGKFADENGPYLIGRLRTLGVDLVRMSVIQDEVDMIAEEVRRCAERSDQVFSTGGVGPTHDDLTFDGVAAAFGVPTALHPELAELVRKHGGADPMALRMAMLPVGAELVWPFRGSFPIVRMRNVWVLPGVPALVKQKFEAIAPRFAGTQIGCARIYASDTESEVATPIAEVAAGFPSVAIGSYPRWGEVSHKLIVTLESRDPGALLAARDALAARLSVVAIEGPG